MERMPTELFKCNRCRGEGRTVDPEYRLWRSVREYVKCEKCDGRGRLEIEIVPYLKAIAETLGLPDEMVKEALHLHQALPARVKSRTYVSGLLVACLYSVARSACLPIRSKEVAEASNISGKWVMRYCHIIEQESSVGPRTCLIQPTIYLERYMSTLGLRPETRRRAADLNRAIIERRLHVGRAPSVVAAATVYIACLLTGELKSKEEVAEAAKVASASIRHCWRELAGNLGLQVESPSPTVIARLRRK